MLHRYNCLHCKKDIEEPSQNGVKWGGRLKRALCRPCCAAIIEERAKSLGAFLLGAIFLCTIPIWAKPLERSQDDKVMARPLHFTDKLAGKAAFHIERRGDDIFMQPVLTPVFKLVHLQGPKPVENEVAQCSVWGREVVTDEKTATKVTAIVLRCGDTEYGVQEVDFVFEEHKSEKVMVKDGPEGSEQ